MKSCVTRLPPWPMKGRHAFMFRSSCSGRWFGLLDPECEGTVFLRNVALYQYTRRCTPENMDLQQHRWEKSNLAPLAPCTKDVPSAVVCHSFFAWSSFKSVTVSSIHSSGLSKGFLSHPCWPTLLTCTCHSTSSVSYLLRVITSETVNYLHIQYLSWTRETVRIVFWLT